MRRSTTSLLLCALACASAQAADPAPGVPGEPPIRKLDGHLVDMKGRGLYTWDGDKTPGESSCVTQCRLLWPPIAAAADATPKGPFTLATRYDGTRQWALRGKPLYRWASDKKWGDAGGDQVAGMWHLVKVAAPKPAAADAAKAAATDASKPAAAAAPKPAPAAAPAATKPSA